MTTPLILLLILTLPYGLSWLVPGWRDPPTQHRAASLGLGLTFLFTASGHFLQTAPMALMLPPWVPARVPLVYATGVLEIVIALGFFWPATRRWAAWSAAAFAQVPVGGHAWGPVYLLVRAPLQVFMLWWIWRFVLRRDAATRVLA